MIDNYLKNIKKDLIECELTSNFDERYAETYPSIEKIDLLSVVAKYPDYNYSDLTKKIINHFKIHGDIILSNGSEDLIIRLNTYLALKKYKIGIVQPIFYRIEETAFLKNSHVDLITYNNFIERKFSNDAVWIQNPNLFSGVTMEKDALVKIIESYPNTLFLIDEAGIFTLKEWEKYSLLQYKPIYNNLAVLSSFSKMYGISGLRAGFLYISGKMMDEIKSNELTFPITSITEIFIDSVIDNIKIVNEIREGIHKNKKEIEDLVEKTGTEEIKTLTNCVFLRNKKIDLHEALLFNKINTFKMGGQYSHNETPFVRITVHSSMNIHNKLIKALSRILYEK